MSVELGSANPHMPNIQRGSLTGVHLAIIMVATAMIAADRYYCQPLLVEMSRTLHLTPWSAWCRLSPKPGLPLGCCY